MEDRNHSAVFFNPASRSVSASKPSLFLARETSAQEYLMSPCRSGSKTGSSAVPSAPLSALTSSFIEIAVPVAMLYASPPAF